MKETFISSLMNVIMRREKILQSHFLFPCLIDMDIGNTMRDASEARIDQFFDNS